MSQDIEREYGWDDIIEKDSNFVILPEGDYDFTVTKFERGRFNGSAKMPACNQAKVELTIRSDQGEVIIIHTLLLHTKTEGLLSNFFAGIGQKRKGEKLKMNWQTVVGSRGRLKLYIDKYKKDNDSPEYTSNKVRSFYPYEEVFGQPPAPNYQQQGQQYQQPPQYQQAPPPSAPPPAPYYNQQPFPGVGAPPQGGGWSQGNF
jgi:hypothetical protein